MIGWNGRFLRVNLTKGTTVIQDYSDELAKLFMGGRGFAVKLLWDELKPGTDPLSPENILIFATGPLTGFRIPSSGKMIVAAKSPLTGGYGDGNIGTLAAPNMRKCGIDAVIITGKAKKPSYLWVEDDDVKIMDATDLWGLNSYEAENKLKDKHGESSGVILIGVAGENLCRISTVVSQQGRAGGRPGMGAVMGSKNLKALVFHGTKDLHAADIETLNDLGKEGYKDILKKDNYPFWMRQSTMAILEWCQSVSTLPTRNFQEGVFKHAADIDGNTMEEMKTITKGCPNCNMTCGSCILDDENRESELDYENVAMLGSNLGIGDLRQVATLNRMCDELGVDTIGAGNVIGFAMEAAEKKLIDLDISFGDFEGAKKLLNDIAYMKNYGALFGLGVDKASKKIGGDSANWAMQIKGMEISGYDCHLCPGMALSFGTSPIGAHHKDAWVISWEMSGDIKQEYGRSKVSKVIEFQRIRGGLFESIGTCRFPWIELGFDLDWYVKYFEAATGLKTNLTEIWNLADRIYALIRAFWIREFNGNWSRQMDFVPERWFNDPLTEGPSKGRKLNKSKYDALLLIYYKDRGWDDRGIPTKETMKRLNLVEESAELEKYVKLTNYLILY